MPKIALPKPSLLIEILAAEIIPFETSHQLNMTDTTCSINDALKVLLMLEWLKSQMDLGQSGWYTPEFVKMKVKMTSALIDMIRAYLNKDYKKLARVPSLSWLTW